ncbi:hypothetical protein SAMN02910280_1243 [Ruminococcus flavefaciens]|uniref:HTH cro/C1-type domain-containing protein n=3 Tax=Ruminococcus TaxID=1263 RepID=A0A1K1MIL5_RUMFL|nr:hypothetical protein SAMN02910280_1243 [Ruminococcus flavefaciens]
MNWNERTGYVIMKKEKRITIYKKIWCKIRYWQNLKDVSDTELAAYLRVCERTLRDYDKNARNITLEKIDNFLTVNSMELDELLAM